MRRFNGHKMLECKPNIYVYADNKHIYSPNNPRIPYMCKDDYCKKGSFKILATNGKEEKIDSCIYPIVKALNDAGLETEYSCCGHGEIEKRYIKLKDGTYIKFEK